MRSCDEIVEWISAGLDGELSADEQAALDEHIACCPACSALLDDLRALHEAAADLEEVPAPAGFAEAVMVAVAAEAAQEKADKVIPFAPKKSKRSYWKQWTVSAAAVAIVVLGAVSAPSLTGNSNATKSADDADRAPALFDSVADVAMEAESYSIDMAQEESFDYTVVSQDNYETSPAEPVPSADVQITTSSSPYDPVKNGNPPSPSEAPETDEERYVGILMLEGPLESLAGQEGVASSDGTVTYIVTADIFAEVLKELETEKAVGYTYTALSSDAQRGKIIVQSMN